MQYRYGYQGQYAERDRETEWNSFELRQYDAVTGRWLSPDPYGQYNSPYVGMGNDWPNQVDPDGGWSWAGAGIGAAVGFGAGSIYGLATGQDNWLQYGLAGAAGGFVGGGLSGNTTRADNNPGGAFSDGGGSHGMTLTASTRTSFSAGALLASSTGLARGLLQYGENPLKKHFDIAVSLSEWVESYQHHRYEDIITEAGWKDGQPLGPKKRFVVNPNDGNVMDMRHVSVIGYGYGHPFGHLIEFLQSISEETRPSAYDPQDYYSNRIGDSFANYTFLNSSQWSGTSWAVRFKKFLIKSQ